MESLIGLILDAILDEIESYIRFYNQERLHQSLDYRTPAALYGERLRTQ